MDKTRLYLLALVIAAVAVAAIGYKWRVLQFPLQPDAQVEVWTLQARIGYEPQRGANRVSLLVPGDTPGWSVLDERFVARGYSRLESRDAAGRELQWAIRRAEGQQALYYRASIVRAQPAAKPLLLLPEGQALIPELDEPYATAARAILDQVRERSADTETFARALVRHLLEPADEDVRLLADLYRDEHGKVALMAGLLASRNIVARPVHGVQLDPQAGAGELRPWLAVHGDDGQWFLVDPRSDAAGWPDNFFLWSVADRPLATVNDAPAADLQFSAVRNLADAVAVAERRLEVRDARLVQFSLLGLPLQAQQTYAVLLMVPVGAFLMLLLRNVVGVKTFGTFMPVLIAIAFRDTGLATGVALFVLVVGAGLLARFYLERLRLLLVARLTAILILVVLLMAAVSIVFHQLDLEVGLSVALFPMVIMAMAIERMSVAWDERGGEAAMREALGTLVVAALAYVLMSWSWLERFVFVFPESLLLLLAGSLLLGRYSGYRLTELYRFRALERGSEPYPDPIAPPP